MKHILLIFAALTFAGVFSVNAQDFMVTKSLDSLNCKLGKLEGDNYFITFYQDYKMTDGYIHKDSILVVRKNMFRSLDNNRLRPWYPVVDFSIDAGATHQTGTFRVDDDLTDKSDFAARTGWYVNAGFIYYFIKTFGLGLKYNYRGLLGGDIDYHYVAPEINVRLWEKNRKNHFFFGASAGFGHMKQKDAPFEYYEQRRRVSLKSSELALDISAGYSKRLSPTVSMLVKVSYNFGKSRHIDINDVQISTNPNAATPAVDGYLDNMNTLNLSLGFTFHSGARQ